MDFSIVFCRVDFLFQTRNHMSETSAQQTIFGVGSELYVREEMSWQQEHVDIIFSLIILFTGIFQYVLRKWILPVSEDVISKLEDQFPTQALIYKPGFGLFFIVIKLVLLVISIYLGYF